MSKISIIVHDLSAAEATALIAQYAGGAPGAPTARPTTPPPPAAPPPTPTPAPVPAASPPPTATPPAPPPSAVPPAPTAPAGAVTVQQVIAAMQTYSATHKSAGVKAVLAKCGLTKVPDANAEQLVWLKAAFESNRAPHELG